ncbi:MAG: threonine synthase, partial [Rhodospirillaceae bacterium]|nr:threonine synthase [Rhodospirillaceae bacterium]
PDKKVSFAVPTGNFGNVFAGFAASKMGLPIEQLIIGSNANDVLIRFIESGKMQLHDVVHTISPSMDIGISSNFERLLFELSGRDGKKVSAIMTDFAKTKSYAVDDEFMQNLKQLFSGARFDDVATKKIIGDVYAENKMLLDPHSAIGLGAARASRNNSGAPVIVLATAHPAKFPDAVMQAANQHPELPPHLADLLSRPERSEILQNSVSVVKEYIEQTLQKRGKS